MTVQFVTAERRKAHLRVGMSGPAGSGKTYSALLLARGLTDSWEKVFVIDTENGSASLYSHLGAFRVFELRAPFTPESYIEAINVAEENGAEVILIDSTSHEWDGKGGCLESNERLASAKYKGNTWAAWSETTPRHQKFIEAITTSPCHIVTTARSKTDTIQTEDKKVKKVGLKEIQREGFEYELTVNFSIDREGHYAVTSKDRTTLFIDRDPFVISQKTGEELLAWTESGKEALVDVNREKKRIIHNLTRLEFKLTGDKEKDGKFIKDVVVALVDMDVTVDKDLPLIVKKLEKMKDVDTAHYVYAKWMAKHGEKVAQPTPAAPAAEPKKLVPGARTAAAAPVSNPDNQPTTAQGA